MSKLTIAADDWVVVCDGRKALICRNVGDEKFINLKVIEERAIDNPPTRAQGTDRPGRTQSSASTERSAVGQTDWHDEAERAFLKEIAARLHEAVASGAARGIVLAAPPRALGMIRPFLSQPTVQALRAEIDKDYVNVPISELEERLKS